MVKALTLTIAACNSSDPPTPHPEGLPNDRWEVYKVKEYRSMEPTPAYNPLDKRNEIWQQYGLTLASGAGVRLTLTCGQWYLINGPANGSEICAQGVLTPNERVWIRAGIRGDQFWVYSNKHPDNSLSPTLWVLKVSSAK